MKVTLRTQNISWLLTGTMGALYTIQTFLVQTAYHAKFTAQHQTCSCDRRVKKESALGHEMVRPNSAVP